MILVTGGTGFIGSHLIDRLAASGEPVRALVRRKTLLPAGVQTVNADLAVDSDLTESLRGVSTILHVAGVTKAVRSEGYYLGNVRAAENLARAATGRGIRFVLVSSIAACGPCEGEAALNEQSAPAPITHYGRSKLEGERAVRAILPDAVIVRPPIVYGPRDVGVYGILKSISRGIVPRIAGGERWFSMVYIDDLLDGLLAAASTPQAAGRTYFISHPDAVNWSTLGAAAGRIMGRNPRALPIPIPAAYTLAFFAENWSRLTRTPSFLSREKIREATRSRWVCDPTLASTELGVESRTSLSAGLAATLAWYKEAGWLSY